MGRTETSRIAAAWHLAFPVAVGEAVAAAIELDWDPPPDDDDDDDGVTKAPSPLWSEPLMGRSN